MLRRIYRRGAESAAAQSGSLAVFVCVTLEPCLAGGVKCLSVVEAQANRFWGSSSYSLVAEHDAVGDSRPVHTRVTDKSYP